MRNSDRNYQVYVVEASAGSGKTYALAKRYIRLLLTSDEISSREILAITFTNKSAIEMKERILELLKKIALNKFKDPLEEKDILSTLGLDKKIAQKRAFETIDFIINNYNFFQVQTIDSFINSLLIGCSFKLGLSANFKIKQEYKKFLTYSLDSIIEKASKDKKLLNLLKEFLKHYLYVENRTGWLPKRDILAIIESLFLHYNIYTGEFKKYVDKGANIHIKKKAVIKLMKKLNDNMPDGVDKRFSDKLALFLEQPKANFDIDDISGYLAREEVPVKKDYNISLSTEKLWSEIRKNINELCEIEAYSIFNPYIDIFKLVFDDFKILTDKEDIMFLGELNKQAQMLFGNVSVPEIYYRLATRFRHYLIDEFQDTSVLQWRNLFLMVEEALSTGGTLFYVGDKKQAIYRFRGGETTLFDDIKIQFDKFGVDYALLNKNFRSEKEIVLFNNEIFSKDNLHRFINNINAHMEAKGNDSGVIFADSDMKRITDIFHDSNQNYVSEKSKGFVKVKCIECNDKEEKDELIKKEVLELVEELNNRFYYRDIAILTRDNSDVELVTTWFIERNIPVESEKTLNIRENKLIKELVSFLKFLNSPTDNLFFASFILSDILLGISGFKREEMEDFLYEIRLKKEKDLVVYLYKEFRDKYSSLWNEYIDSFFKSVGIVPLYELLISIMEKFKILDRFIDNQSFFMAFLELVKKSEEEYVSIDSFLEFFDNATSEELYVNVSGTDSVKVMTIHKAKGLEFPVVIIPFLEVAIHIGEKDKRGFPYVIMQEKNNLRLIRLKSIYRIFSEKLNEKYQNEYKKSFIDELNNIYVAFTRSKYELYVFIPADSSNRLNLAKELLNAEGIVDGKKIESIKDEKPETSLIRIPSGIYKDWIHMLKEEFASVLGTSVKGKDVENREKLLRGEVLHCIFSFIGNLFYENKDEVIKDAIEKTKMNFLYFTEFDELEKIARKTVNDNKLKNFFYLEKGNVYTEKDIVDTSGNTKRIDRLILLDKEVWVVDYKSSKEGRERYDVQMDEYIKLISNIYPDLKIRGFFIYLDNFNFEEVHG